MSVVDELVKVALLGATWVLYVLFALSLVSFAAMFERWLFFRRNRRGAEALRPALLRAIAAEEVGGVEQVLGASPTVEAQVLREALGFRAGGSEAFLEAVDGALAAERASLDRGTVLLGTVGNNAPFVGLFGTVLGIIEAFSYLGTGDQSAMGNVMAGISEALVATAVGIFVAIPAVVGYNLAQKKGGDIENNVFSLARTLSAWLRLVEARGGVAARPADTTHDDDAEGEKLARLPDRRLRRASSPAVGEGG